MVTGIILKSKPRAHLKYTYLYQTHFAGYNVDVAYWISFKFLVIDLCTDIKGDTQSNINVFADPSIRSFCQPDNIKLDRKRTVALGDVIFISCTYSIICH